MYLGYSHSPWATPLCGFYRCACLHGGWDSLESRYALRLPNTLVTPDPETSLGRSFGDGLRLIPRPFWSSYPSHSISRSLDSKRKVFTPEPRRSNWPPTQHPAIRASHTPIFRTAPVPFIVQGRYYLTLLENSLHLFRFSFFNYFHIYLLPTCNQSFLPFSTSSLLPHLAHPAIISAHVFLLLYLPLGHSRTSTSFTIKSCTQYTRSASLFQPPLCNETVVELQIRTAEFMICLPSIHPCRLAI